MRDVRLIALDLDGTLLNSRKELTPRSLRALEAAAAAGIQVVPSTGRFYRGIPEPVRRLPFVRYVITVNGAQVWDVAADRSLYSSDIPLDRALALLETLDREPVIYDCYQEGWGWMTQSMRERAAEFIDYAPSLDMIRTLRSGVPELKSWLRDRGLGVQKIQFFTRDRALRDRLLAELSRDWPDLAVTNSLPNNGEVNAASANKGDALLALARQLGLTGEQTAAFGDGTNDLAMLRAAGFAVAMANGAPAVKAAADRIAPSNDEDGAARVIEEILREVSLWKA